MYCNFHELNHFYGCVSFTQRNMTNFSDRYLGAPQFKWKIPLNFMDNCLKVTRCYARTDQGKILLTPMHLFRVLCAFLVVAQPDGVSFRLTCFVSNFFALLWNQCKPWLQRSELSDGLEFDSVKKWQNIDNKGKFSCSYADDGSSSAFTLHLSNRMCARYIQELRCTTDTRQSLSKVSRSLCVFVIMIIFLFHVILCSIFISFATPQQTYGRLASRGFA